MNYVSSQMSLQVATVMELFITVNVGTHHGTSVQVLDVGLYLI